MNPTQWTRKAVGLLVGLRHPPRHDERGLSQSTENAVLLAGAAAVALVVITVITAYVTDNLNNLPG